MGLLSLFSRPTPNLLKLPSGSFTVDREGSVIVGTLPSSFPMSLAHDIGEQVLAAFRDAERAQLPLASLSINYASLKISAREMRGGAIIFLSPKAPYGPAGQT
jgi:hypothetical protein